MTTPYIYVASSWRNASQPAVIKVLRGCGAINLKVGAPEFGVYDFKDSEGFRWTDVDPTWDFENREPVDLLRYAYMSIHPLAQKGYWRDMDALKKATAALLVLPCGRSAHLEFGYAVGQGKQTAIYYPEKEEPDLMWKMADEFIHNASELVAWGLDIFS